MTTGGFSVSTLTRELALAEAVDRWVQKGWYVAAQGEDVVEMRKPKRPLNPLVALGALAIGTRLPGSFWPTAWRFWPFMRSSVSGRCTSQWTSTGMSGKNGFADHGTHGAQGGPTPTTASRGGPRLGWARPGMGA